MEKKLLEKKVAKKAMTWTLVNLQRSVISLEVGNSLLSKKYEKLFKVVVGLGANC